MPSRIQRGCAAAVKVGLKDCQGFVIAQPPTPIKWEPIVFIDIHTSWNANSQTFGPSVEANEMLDVINKWAA